MATFWTLSRNIKTYFKKWRQKMNKPVSKSSADSLGTRLSKIMAELAAVPKGRVNEQQGYEYRGIDDLYNTLHRLFAKYGVYTFPNVKSIRTDVYDTSYNGRPRKLFHTVIEVVYTVTCETGESFQACVPGEALDYSDKGVYKALSGAHKYLLFQLFIIPTQEPEPESDHIEVPAKPVEQPKEAPKPTEKEPEAEPAKEVKESEAKQKKPIPHDAVEAFKEQLRKAKSIEELDATFFKAVRQFKDEPLAKVEVFKLYDQIRKSFAPSQPKPERKKEAQDDEILF